MNKKTEDKRKSLSKKVFYFSWPIWALIMIPQYWPNKCAAFFDFLFNASFQCPPISLGLSLVLGSLFMAFITWLVGWIVLWLYFNHKELNMKNIKKWLKE